MLHIAIIEDEEKTAEILIKYIKNISPDYEICGIADTISSGIELIMNNKPDIVFFDVELKDGLSFEILKKLPEINFQIIFTTAHSQYAINAFEYSALDYIIKPTNPESITKALLKAEKKINNETLREKINILINNLNTHPEHQKIALQTADSNYYICIDEILRCEAENNYCNFILENGEKILVSKPLKIYEQQLPASVFFRVHQSHLINLHKIRQVKKRTCKILMCNGESIPLSARRKDALLEKLKTFKSIHTQSI
ncbi:MAG TPA: LytTR family DNA-binding domain-containing protein [Prolixibacteraceae bacterium]|nr:LytTR family DNA-binding domain-containing protein [Prolixibacteraceae bacterium]